MWKFRVKNQSIEVLEREVLADHQIQYVQFRFTFDGDKLKMEILGSGGPNAANVVLEGVNCK